ncbi:MULTISPECIES: hypothetical protein [unclassified Mycobacterium]|uniref:hypothetical protein n=1 Tax=Mycobacterium TaxID=1763 RepID=UPI00041A2953|nr:MULTISPECIES: hypothetical protein [unclassified Mycobacterium]ORW90264.1 hypothetical protein AWB92_20575 [Mycobacterium sp. IEC1808]
MFESMLVIASYVTAVFAPVLIPVTVHAVHFFRDLRPTYRPIRAVSAVRLPRLAVPRRVAAPAMG